MEPVTETTTPLTPAQVAALEQMLVDREADMRAYVQAQIEAAVAPLRAQLDTLTAQVATLQEGVAILDGAAVKFGGSLALRAAAGKLLCAPNGGPTVDGEKFRFEARSTIGQWESLGVERGV